MQAATIRIRRWTALALLVLGCASAPDPTPDATPVPPRPLKTVPFSAPAAPPPASWELVAAGDTMLDGSAREIMQRYDYNRPFAHVVTALRQADAAYVNLEAPVAAGGTPVAEKTYTFRQPPAAITAIARAGIDVVHLANNHLLDYGPEALAETQTWAARHGIASCGAGANLQAARQPAHVTTARGIRFAFLCYSNTFPKSFWATEAGPGTAFGDQEHVRSDVARAVTTADVVVAGFHWGAELMRVPKPYQVELAHAALEAGAAIVLGHHPHVLQPVEVYTRKGQAIAYSLGNFAFGSYSRRVSESALLRIRGHGAHVTEAAVLPLDVYNPRVLFQPRPLPATAAARVAGAVFGTAVTAARNGWYTPHVTDTSTLHNAKEAR